MEYDDIILTKENGIATITLNRPERLNALTRGMMESLPEVCDEVKHDTDVRVVVLTGAGRGFCAGADLGVLAARAGSQTNQRPPRIAGRFLSYALVTIDKPTIAMVNGAAVGGGCDLAIACDMRIAGESAKFGEVYIKRGLVPSNGGAWLLPRLVGLSKACELLLTGDIIDAREAERIGLVSKVVPDDQLEAETMSLAKRIAEGPPVALRYTKACIYESLSLDFLSSLNHSAMAASIVNSTEDYREGVRAQMERRPPVFKGR